MTKPQCPTGRLNEQTVKRNIANTQQITFEVTDACNLRCDYCGVGDMYESHDKRENQFLDLKKATHIIEYVIEWIQSPFNTSLSKELYIGFYGGEPLLNMELMKEIVSYVKQRKNVPREIIFIMTTNGVLLHKHINYLVENDFSLLISIDGNRENHSYRNFHNGKNSFDVVMKNIKMIQKDYPDYFSKKVSFNAVLHNKNSINDIYHFFQTEFDKKPAVSELNTFGVKPENKEQFLKMFRNKYDSLGQAEEYISDDLFLQNPDVMQLLKYIHVQSNNVYGNYPELMYEKPAHYFLPTGTCSPFTKKIFVTVTGKILPCERIDHCFALGEITEEGVQLDFNYIVQKYNNYYDKLYKLCKSCYHCRSCYQCLFYLEGIETKPKCNGFINKQGFMRYHQYHMDYLSKHPDLYGRIMKDVTIE